MKRTKKSARSTTKEREEREPDLTPFLLAVERGKLSEIKKLYEGDPSVLNDKTAHDQTPFHIVAKRGSLSVCEYLFSLSGITKSLVNSKDNKGMTCLHLAACGSNHELLLWLLKQDLVNVKSKTKEDESTLHLLAKYFPVVEEEVVKILILVGLSLLSLLTL